MRSIHQYIAAAMFALISGLTVADNHTPEVGVNVAPASSEVASDASAGAPPTNTPTESVEQGVSDATEASSTKKRTPDIRTIIDISGSMKKTDPNNLRAPAMRLLVDLLPKDSKSGVWTFGQYVNMLVKHRVIDEAWKEEAKQKSNDVSSVGLFTNIGDAVNTAGYDLDRLNADYEPFFILLTDGMVDVDKDPEVNKKEQERILKELVPKFADAGVKLHTIALSDKADQDFLQQLSLSTGGMSTVAENSDELLKAFVRLFDQSVPSEEVPLQDNKFLIDSSIEEFTALIFRKEGSEATQLLAPDESVITANSNDPDVTWHTDEKYDLITVKRPYEGEWSLQAESDPDNRVTVVSDLTLQFEEIPPTIFSGEEINIHAWFDSEDGQVKESEFLSLLDGTLQLTNEAGKSIQKDLEIQTEGEFQHAFYDKIRNLRRPGEFEISVLVDGKTFKRQRSHRVEVLEPFAYQVDYDGVGEESVGYVSAVPLLSGLDLEKTKVIAQVKAPDDSSLIASAELQLTQDGQKWVVQVVPTKGEGTYRVSLDLRLTLETGKEFRLKPKPFDLLLPHYPEGYIPPAPEPKVEETIKPVIEEQKMSMPEQTTTVAEQMPEKEPKPEEEGDNMFVIIMAAVLALVAGILGFLVYKLRSHKKVQGEINDEEAAAEVIDDDMKDFNELDTGELNESVEEPPELSEQVDAVREELEKMGGVPEDSENAGVTEDSMPDLDQDELVSALDELSGNDMDLDADDMMDDPTEAFTEQVDEVKSAPETEEMSIEDSIDQELDALLEETETDVEDMMDEADELLEEAEETEPPVLEEAEIPTLDEEAEEPELEIDFDSESELPDASDVSDDDVADMLEAVQDSAETSELDELMDEVDSAQSAEGETVEDLVDELVDDSVGAESTELEDEFIEDDDAAVDMVESEDAEMDTEIDDFGDSIDQALDELLAETDDSVETTEEFDIDDLDDFDSELEELTKDLEAEAKEDSDLDSLIEDFESESDDLDELLSEGESLDVADGQDALEAALEGLDEEEPEPPMQDELAALEDISADELNAPDDGEVDIDRIMAEIDAEAMRQNQEDKDS